MIATSTTVERRTSAPAILALAVLVLAATLACAPAPARAARENPDDGNASWRSEPVVPPELPSGEKSHVPIGLGHIGDIEFLAPNRGLLITAGNGSAIPAGVWAYNGAGWHELSTVCGATDGRIAWAGSDEFWTISDGRPGQAPNGKNEQPPLEDNTLCHFSGGQVVGSYASLAFQSTSYEAMHAGACLSPSDCWFGGEPLPSVLPTVGSFHLHWSNGSLAAEAYEGEAQPVEDMRPFEGQLYESVRLLPPREVFEPPTLHVINPVASKPTFESISGLPLYAPGEFPEALNFLHLSTAEGALWAASGPAPGEPPAGSSEAGVTIARYTKKAGWTQVIGPETAPTGQELFPGDVVTSIAAEPGSESAWVALDTQSDAERPSATAPAIVARVSADGTISDEQALPASGEGIGPKGGAAKIACPAAHDCWLTTTQGWLFHLTTGESFGLDNEGFTSLITFRPPDAGVPQVIPDTPPADDSGLLGEIPPALNVDVEKSTPLVEGSVTLPLLSGLHSRLVHGSTLELSFRLAVEARVRLIAKRHQSTVASTPTKTFPAGKRKLLLHLDPRRWPTKLDLQTHALSKLPTVPLRSPSSATNTVSTGIFVAKRAPSIFGPGLPG
jgi:hypothetical protein